MQGLCFLINIAGAALFKIQIHFFNHSLFKYLQSQDLLDCSSNLSDWNRQFRKFEPNSLSNVEKSYNHTFKLSFTYHICKCFYTIHISDKYLQVKYPNKLMQYLCLLQRTFIHSDWKSEEKLFQTRLDFKEK